MNTAMLTLLEALASDAALSAGTRAAASDLLTKSRTESDEDAALAENLR